MQQAIHRAEDENPVLHNGVSVSQVDYAAVFAALPGRSALLAVDAPKYTVLATTNKFWQLSFKSSEDIKGKGLWEAYRPNPEEPFFTADFNLRQSFEKVIAEKKEDILPVQRYDIRYDDNKYEESYWRVTNSPVLDKSGQVMFIIHTADDITERIKREYGSQGEELAALKLAKEALAVSEQRLRSLVNSAPFPIGVYIGREMRIVLANQSIIDTWGKGSDIVGRLYAEVLPELNSEIYKQLDDVYTTGIAYHAKNRRVDLVVDNKLQPYYFNYSFTPLFDANGNVYGVMNTAAEVTDLMMAKRQIEESEQNLRNIVTQAPVAMCILRGKDFVVEIANTHMIELWGKQDHDLLGNPLFEAVPEVKDQGFEQLLLGVFKTGLRFSANERPVNLNRNGKIATAYVNFAYEALIEGDGSISAVMVVATDVTEQVTARQQVVQSEARTCLAVEATRLGTYEIDIAKQEIIHNARLAEIFGFPPSKPVAYTSLRDVIHPDDREIRLTAHAIASETSELFYEARVIHPDGTTHWIRLNGKFIFRDEIPATIIGTVLDITEEKKLSEILEQRIEERTKELLQTNAQLEKTNTELEQFTHVSSHDLQEPLRKIKLFTNLITNRPKQDLDENVSLNLNKIKETADRMSSTLTALLNYTQLKQPGEFVEVDLNEIVEGVLTDLELVISEKNALVHYDKLPVIKGVPHQMQQLFYNLLSNALKFSKPGIPPVIAIITKLTTGSDLHVKNRKDGQFVEITVEDNGVGFDQRFSEKIFSIFQRLHNKQAYPGTGIGLAICKKVVENHQGAIWATSQHDKGSRFHVLLPAD